MSYDATFESVDVPAAIREEKRRMGRGGRSDVEFTFEKGRWGHLGEATLWNRVKSHTDVGERWYPEILGKIRAEQAKLAAEEQRGAKEQVDGGDNRFDGLEKPVDRQSKGTVIEAH